MADWASTDKECFPTLVATENSGKVLKLTGPLTIHLAGETRNAIRGYLANLAEDLSPTFDLSEVERCDAAGLQVLYSAHRTAEGMGKSLAFAALSEAVRDANTALGLPQWWTEEPASPHAAAGLEDERQKGVYRERTEPPV